MNILVAFNDNYAMPTKVMLKSLIDNNCENINIYVLYISLTEDSINKLSSLNSSRSMIRFIQIDESMLENVPITRFYSKETYIRLFAHLYLPEEMDRILWLDSDVLVNGEIEEFYHQSFKDKLYVAYKDPIQGDSAEKKISLGMPVDAVYVNAGVLLLNLEEIRKRIHVEDITDYIRKYYDNIEFVDQDVINGFLYDSIKVIKSKNYKYNYFVSRITSRNRRRVYYNVRIIHYAMEKKPWKKGFKYHGFHLWWKYALMTDKSNIKQLISIYPSFILAKSDWWLRSDFKRMCPTLFGLLKEMKRRIIQEKK